MGRMGTHFLFAQFARLHSSKPRKPPSVSDSFLYDSTGLAIGAWKVQTQPGSAIRHRDFIRQRDVNNLKSSRSLFF